MKTIFIFPILFLVFGVSEHQTAVLDDCDEDLSTSSPFSKSVKQQTQRKNDVFTTKPPPLQMRSKEASFSSFQQSQKPSAQQQVSQYKKQNMQSVRKTISGPPSSQYYQPKRPKRPLNRRQQRPIMWPSKPKHVLIKPLAPKPVEPPTKRKLTDYFPSYQFKKQKRIKIIPTYEEYEAYPETDYVHELVYPEPRNYDYVEMDNAGSFGVPCDHNDSEYKDLSMEDHNDEPEIVAREMDVTEEFSSTEKLSDSEVFTEGEIEVTTPITIFETVSENIEARDADIPISSTPETLTNVMEMLIKGVLALISCMKSKAPFLDDIISNVLNTAINSCSSFSS